jgi:hypothetical protein
MITMAQGSKAIRAVISFLLSGKASQKTLLFQEITYLGNHLVRKSLIQEI